MAHSPSQLDQLFTSNEAIWEVWYQCWTDPIFQTWFIIFSIVFLVIWAFATFAFGIKDIEFIGYIGAAIHACCTVIICFLIIFNYNESDLLQINIDQGNNPNTFELPFLFRMLKLYGIFQTAFFFVEGIQLLFCYQHRTISYRVSLIGHHLLTAACSCCIYKVDPFIAYIYVYDMAIEFSNIFMSLRYFGREWGSKSLFFIGGVGTLIFYPSCRICITIYVSYVAWHGPFYLFVGKSGVVLVVSTNMFILLLSLYYSMTIWSNPKSFCMLKDKGQTKEKQT